MPSFSAACPPSPSYPASAPLPPPPPTLPPPCTVQIPNPSTAPSLPVPPSFLGLSHEPLTIAAPVLRDSTYRRLLLLLSFRTGPFILRWGGSKQDERNTTLGSEHWATMRDVHKALGVRYMLGLSLAVGRQDAVGKCRVCGLKAIRQWV